MRSFGAVLATTSLLAAGSALAEPMRRGDSCLAQADAQQLATNFGLLLTNYSDDLADAALSTTFSDYSDSVTTLIDSGCTGPQPLGEATFDSLESFKKGQGGQPAIPFEQLGLWYNCDNVFLRWRSAQTPELITGIIVLEAVQAPAGNEYPWVINTVYSEFNSGAWLVNLGVFTPTNCSTSVRRLLRA